ncbi:hypothetical protein [Bradyrhizobium sp. BR 1432]|uniref:hypothetical protein n=1 Tax=Bradyrhizobium sp. BR 1432 TaxID=3447966 RepID=UPI003EE7DE7A
MQQTIAAASVAAFGGQFDPSSRHRTMFLFVSAEQDFRAHVEVVFRQKRPDMPAWLEVLLNLSGYAGFVALATRGGTFRDRSADDRICGEKR